MTTCAVVGLEQEAAIVRHACPNAVIVVGAGDAALLTARLEAALGQNAVAIDRVVSVGICGGLNHLMGVGHAVVGTSAVYKLAGVVCDLAWSGRIYDALVPGDLSFPVSTGMFAWSPTAVGRLVDRAALRRVADADVTEADVVDEESFISGLVAKAHGLPWAALRVVCDPSWFELPPAALTKLTATGANDMGAILGSIMRDPWEIPELFELAWMSSTALGNLRAALARVGPDFAAT